MQISELKKDSDLGQFFVTVDGHRAFIDYTLDDSQYELVYSEVPEELRGRGIGKILVEKTLDAIAAEGKTAVPACSYIRHIAGSSDRWRDTVVSG